MGCLAAARRRLSPGSWTTAAALCLLALPIARARALGDPPHVVFAAQPGAFPLVSAGHAIPIYLDVADWPGVARATASFAQDVASVTGTTPAILHDPTAPEIILVGTIGRSPAIDRLIAAGLLDVAAVRGHWETSVTQVLDNPLPGVRRALVVAGADKRGTIFGLYDLSEQIGVSPWSWWADVPIRHNSELFLLPGRFLQPEPRVKYRGIFLNDDAPALSNWTQEKFGGKGHAFYEHVFELLLRLKANFLWPAMWNNAFNEDDPADPRLADEYGIVMGTSHHEPMMRAQQEWKRHGTGPWDYTQNQPVLDQFWRQGVLRNRAYEQLTTIGMRGDGDMAMSASTNTALLERIVANQRKIIAQSVNPDVTKVPQVWALYKEVQGYYEKGMRVPNDVTLLWCDDNWGNLRRLPTPAERKRPGGAGIYYHFDYVGDPRSYKWLLTYNITKIWEQMHLAADYGADRMWIVNVGDLKPMEFPIEFFLNMARTPDRYGPGDLQRYTESWAAREFGPQLAPEIASLVDTYTRYNSRRKPEQLEPATYSLIHDHEADRIEREWLDLTARAEAVDAALPEAFRPAFFELVLYPIQASANLGEMYIAAARNRLYARQGRASANFWADETARLFARDATLTNQYHQLLGGKWHHMMDQTHIGYTFWNEPPLNAMPPVQRVQPPPSAQMLVFAEGSEDPATALPPFDSTNRQTRTFDLANRGTSTFGFTIRTSDPWISVNATLHRNATTGSVTTDQRLDVSIDWTHLPPGDAHGTITIAQDRGPSVRLAVEVLNPSIPLAGFVEDNASIAIDAEHTDTRTPAAGISWQTIPGFGETLSGVATFPDTAPATLPGQPQPCLAYTFTVLHPGDWTLHSLLAPTLPFAPGRGLRYSIAVDALPQKLVDAWPTYTDAEWSRAVSDGVHRISTPLGQLAAGIHRLHFCRVDPGVIPERLILFHGAAPATYLGPPESKRATQEPSR